MNKNARFKVPEPVASLLTLELPTDGHRDHR